MIWHIDEKLFYGLEPILRIDLSGLPGILFNLQPTLIKTIKNKGFNHQKAKEQTERFLTFYSIGYF